MNMPEDRDNLLDNSPAPDPIEHEPTAQELQRLQPRQVSPQLAERVKADLADYAPVELAQDQRFRSRLTWVAAAAIAAGVVWFVAAQGWLGFLGPLDVEDLRRVAIERPDAAGDEAPSQDTPRDHGPSAGSSAPPPTLAAYRQAGSRSSAAVDELLDYHAGVLLGQPGEIISAWRPPRR